MREIKITDDTFWVGVNDRTTDLFEGLWPIDTTGISYNSYAIKDRKNVLIDLAKAFKTDDFFDQISNIVPFSDINYIILNHMEPDHTGVIKTLRMLSPQAEIICTPKAVRMLNEYYGITERIRTVNDGDTLDIGSRTISFHHVPFVHWPETMVTYDQKTNVLFSCDAFGGYGALQGALFDDEYSDMAFYEKESLRYYANIVAKFALPVLNAIKKLSPLEIKCIAPSHGLVWRKSPAQIVELYRRWAEYGTNGGEKGVTLLYGSMYGNTEIMMNAIAEGIASGGICPEIFDVSRNHPSYMLPALLVNKGVAAGAPTYEAALFPYMQNILEKAALKSIRNKKAVYFGSYGWSKGALKKTRELTEPLGWHYIGDLEFAGGPKPHDIKKGFELGRLIAEAASE
ncbi:MAG: FprA family A-type flavoprotein [Chitinispirillaceae bacterium]|nr:FprA family A-type flavoprotein [Chitinispirillaceae bacterium]